MAYITRDDGEHFVIPAYRDVLVIAQKTQLKREILNLSQSYGPYITLQKKSGTQYEVAFSTETGYLLGESIWQYFKRPEDMIYCEAIPNTTEAIFVIVKSGSVYLDGKFPLDSIAEELIIFLTQQNQFQIYTYGDVPLSETPQDDKFNFEPNSVKSFNRLDKPVFEKLPLYKMYQLQLVETVLRTQGIGVFPYTPLITLAVLLGLGWFGYSYLMTTIHEREAAQPIEVIVNPYQSYISALNSPDPAAIVYDLTALLAKVSTISGWHPTDLDYKDGVTHIKMSSNGGRVRDLQAWGDANAISTYIKQDGIFLSKSISPPNRDKPKTIYKLDQVLADFMDKLYRVYPGNHIRLNTFSKKGNYSVQEFAIELTEVSPSQFNLIAQQFRGLPLNFTLTILRLDENSNLSGSLLMEALGT